MKSFKRFIATVLLVPLCLGVGASFFSLLATLKKWPASNLPFLLGFASYVAIHVIMFKPLRTYVFGHELTHALASIMIGGRVKKFKVSKKGGSVLLTKTNLFVALAPYCFPLYTAMLLIGFATAGMFLPVERYHGVFLYGLGFTLAFHLFLTIDAMFQDQPDITQSGVLLSVLIVFLSNILVIVFVLSLFYPQVSIKRFARNSVGKTYLICSWTARKSMNLWNALSEGPLTRPSDTLSLEGRGKG